MSKNFKTIDELVGILESRGIKTDENTKHAIARESYYAIVNGYKTPFLDSQAMQSTNTDVYKSGVEFDWLYSLFLFDRELRILTFDYLIKAEARLKTAVVYSFCHNHQQGSDYLEISNYCTPSEYLVPKAFKGNKKAQHTENLSRLMSKLNSNIVIRENTRDFIKHYLTKYGFVPLWVLSNELTFGTIVNMFQLMQPNDRNEACTIIAKEAGNSKRRYLSPRKLLRYSKTLVFFRNICAHDERLYCAKNGNDGLNALIAGLNEVLGEKETNTFRNALLQLYQKYRDKLHIANQEELFRDISIYE